MDTGAKVASAAGAALLLTLLLARGAAAEDGQVWVADFTVADEGTMSPLAGAIITISGVSRTTDSSGKVSIQVMPGQYSFSVACPGYEPFEGTFTVPEAVALAVDAETWLAEFTITDQLSKVPLPGAVITMSGISQITGAAGTASFTVVAGQYSFSVTCSGYEPFTGSFQVQEEPPPPPPPPPATGGDPVINALGMAVAMITLKKEMQP